MHLIFFSVICFVIWVIWFNNHHIVITEQVYSQDVSTALDGLKILQISDIHGDLSFLKEQALLRKISAQKPDILVVTGDCIDKIHIRQQAKLLDLLVTLKEMFPMYVVAGNHEYMDPECEKVLKRMEQMGIAVLHDQLVDFPVNGDVIQIIGLDDPYALYAGEIPERYCTPEKEFKEHLRKVIQTKDSEVRKYILLSHRPEFFEAYVETGVDIVFAGHAHGGQWRLPFFGPVIAPDQGIRPQYTSGCYQKGKTVMYVSRGLGNSVVPVRLFNFPELVVVKFEKR